MTSRRSISLPRPRRDATLILLMARHGLRVSEAVDLAHSGPYARR